MMSFKTYKIGCCLVIPSENVIQVDGFGRCTIQPKVLEILNYLVQEHPRVISREELIDKIWNGNHYVGEKALTNAIWNLRRYIKESGSEDEIIETIRKRGYRLLIEPEIFDNKTPNKKENKFLQKPSIWGSTLFLSIIVIFIVIYWANYYETFERKDIGSFSTHVSAITSEPGEELFVSVSPDGQYIVYQYSNLLTDSNLFLKNIKKDNIPIKQLTFDQAIEGHSVWSPDQKYLFFSRQGYDFCHYIQMDITNLFERKIAECPMTTYYNYLDVSPDGIIFAFLGIDKETKKNGIYFIDLTSTSLEPKRFSCNIECEYQDKDMGFSPDGKYLAVTRRFNDHSEDIYVYDFDKKEYASLTEEEEDIVGFTWHNDSRHLAYGIRNSEIRSGYYFDIFTREKLALNIVGFSYPDFDKTTNALFYQQRLGTYQINKLSVEQSVASLPLSILKSEFRYKNPDYSPATNKIAYVSNESRSYELWVSDTNGQNREKLTDLKTIISFPRWSHDGKKIAFLAPVKNKKGLKVYIIDIFSKQVSKLVTPFDDHDRPTWSYNDKSIISSVSDQNKTELYLFPLSSGKLKKLTDDGGVFGIMPSKNTLVYTKSGYGLWQKNLESNKVNMIASHDIFSKYYSWAYTTAGIYYPYSTEYHQEMRFYSFNTKTAKTLAKFPIISFAPAGALAFDANKKELIYSSRDYGQSDIMKLTHAMFNDKK